MAGGNGQTLKQTFDLSDRCLLGMQGVLHLSHCSLNVEQATPYLLLKVLWRPRHIESGRKAQ